MQKEALTLEELKADFRERWKAEPQKAALAVMALESAQYAINELARFGLRFEFHEAREAPPVALAPAPGAPVQAHIDSAFAKFHAALRKVV